jgi:hypothetical protein
VGEEDARRELELLGACDIDDNDPLIAHYSRYKHVIRVSLRSGAPGAGKTWKLSQDWEHLPGKKLLLSHSHNYLSEQGRRWSERMSVRHLWGLRWICPCITTREHHNKVIEKLVDLKLSHKHICGTCKTIKAYPQKDCPYKNQFKDLPNVVIAPIEYAFTNFLESYKPDFIAVDDCTLKMRLHPKKQTLENYLQHLQHIYYENVKKHGVANLRELFTLPERDYQSFMKKMRRAHRNYLKLNIDEVVRGDKSDTFLYVATSPDEIDTYRKHAFIYGFKNRFATPALFPLFDYIAKHKKDEPQLKIIDAIINPKIFEILRTRYLLQGNRYIDFRDDDFRYKIEDKGSVVHRCRGTRSDAWYPTTGSIVKDPITRQRIQQWISRVLKTQYNGGAGIKIGLVIPKQCDRRQFISEDLNVKVLTFGNLRGKNSLEDCDILFVIGTYNINHDDLIKDFSLFCADEPMSKDYVEDERHGGRYHFKDIELEAYRWAHEDYEQYQAFHRIRPLLRKKMIYGFCAIPNEIEQDGILVKNYQFKRRDEGTKRSEWLLDYVKQRGRAPIRDVAWAIHYEFDISRSSAYQLIHKVVDSSKQLSISLRDGRQQLAYEENA